MLSFLLLIWRAFFAVELPGIDKCRQMTQFAWESVTIDPSRIHTARESTREVRGTTSSCHFFSGKGLKLRIPKKWLGSRNKIRFPIKFANVEHLQQFLPGASLQPCTKITQSPCTNPSVSRKTQKSECTMPNSVYNAQLILNLSKYSSLYKRSRGTPFLSFFITRWDLKSKAVIKLFTHA